MGCVRQSRSQNTHFGGIWAKSPISPFLVFWAFLGYLGDLPIFPIFLVFLILAIFQYGLANILFSIGIKRTDPVEASLLLSIEPVFNPIPVAIFCGEMMTPLAIAGSVIVIAAVTLHGLLPQLQERAALKRERGKP